MSMLFPIIIVVAISVGMIVFWIRMIIDCVTKEPSEGNDKIAWLLVILLTQIIGALIYYFVRRPQRIRAFGY